MLRAFVLFCLFQFILAPPQANAQAGLCRTLYTESRSSEIQAVRSESKKNLQKHEQIFTRTRGLGDYAAALGHAFSARVAELMKKGGHWLDAGSGDGIAVEQFLGNSKAETQATVISLETKATESPRQKVLRGRFLEEIPDAEIQPADLITDVFGPLAYSGAPHLILQKYFSRLKEGGEIHLFLGSMEECYGRHNRLVTADGKYLTLAEWIQRIPGVKAELFIEKKEDDGTILEKWSMRLTRKEGETVTIPEVELVHLQEGAPPKMLFKEVASGSGTGVRSAAQSKMCEAVSKMMGGFDFTRFIQSFRSGEFTHPLLAALRRLSPGDSWANLSPFGEKMKEAFRENQFDASKTDVFIKLAQNWIRWRVGKIHPDRFEYSRLDRAESLRGMKDIALITDLNGDFTTSLAPDQTLRTYLKSLRADGEIFLFLGPEIGGFGTGSEVIGPGGTRKNIRAWLQGIPGLKVQFYRGGYAWTGGEWTFVKITKNGDVKIPELKLIGSSETQDQPVPRMIFQETGPVSQR